MLNILGLTLEQTCRACPEQYDVFQGERKVGYLRARHGRFRADYLFCGGDTVYESRIDGDGCLNDDERAYHLFTGVTALLKRLNSEQDFED